MKIWKRNEVWRRIYLAKIYFIDRWQQNNPSTKIRTLLLSDDIEDYRIMKSKCEEWVRSRSRVERITIQAA